MESSPQLLVIGATGQVGGALVERIGPGRWAGTSHAVAMKNTLPFDLETAATDRRYARDLLGSVHPSAVLIAAGFTWVDGCEKDPERALRVNRDGPAALARAARSLGARTVFYSTAYVFDGRAGPYSEDDRPCPISVYGRSKLEGEWAVLDEDPDALILRTAVVYGPEVQGKNFAYQLAAHLCRGRSMRVPDDQIASPTYNRDCADATIGLLECGARGVYNLTSAECLDRAAFARRLARAAGLDAELIEAVPTEVLAPVAPRPLRAGTKIGKLRSALPGWSPRTVEDAVEHWRAHPRGKPWPN